jgi:hypothetical protein
VKPVSASRRWYRLDDGGELRYEYAMAVGDMAEPQPHLSGTLSRS